MNALRVRNTDNLVPVIDRDRTAAAPIGHPRGEPHPQLASQVRRASEGVNDVIDGTHALTLRKSRNSVNAHCGISYASVSGMTTIADRLRQARKRRGFESATDAARAFNWAVSTYLGHENGDRVPKRSTLARYSSAFQADLGWLEFGDDVSPVVRTIPVLGYIGLGEVIEMTEATQSPLEHIELPYGFSVENCGALIAKGNSQFPRVKDREVVIYSTDGHSPDDMIGREAVVGLRNGNVMLKTLRRGSVPGRYNLESHNAPLLENEAVEWVGQLLSIVPEGQWRKLR